MKVTDDIRRLIMANGPAPVNVNSGANSCQKYNL